MAAPPKTSHSHRLIASNTGFIPACRKVLILVLKPSATIDIESIKLSMLVSRVLMSAGMTNAELTTATAINMNANQGIAILFSPTSVCEIGVSLR